MTSSYTGSESPKSTHSDLDQSDSLLESESNSDNNCNSLPMNSSMANNINEELNPPANISAKIYLGSMRAMSNNTLDWAIVPIKGECENLATSVIMLPDGNTCLNIQGIADPEPISDRIWALTASNGAVKGRLSTVPYYLKSSGSKTFQRTWMAYLEDDVSL